MLLLSSFSALSRGSVVDPPGQPSSNQPTRTDRNCPSTTVRWRISGCLLPPQTPSKIPFYAPHPLVGWSDRLSVVTIHARWTDGHDEQLPTCRCTCEVPAGKTYCSEACTSSRSRKRPASAPARIRSVNGAGGLPLRKQK